jgi:hypothetical protein
VLRRILGLNREEVTADWRKLQTDVHNLQSSPDIISLI